MIFSTTNVKMLHPRNEIYCFAQTLYCFCLHSILVIRKGRRLHEVDLKIHLTCAFNELRVGAHSLLRH